MRARLILKPGQNGTKQEVEQYGDRLVCVRYRYDPERGKRYKTVELITEESDWQPDPRPDEIVGIRLAFEELELRQRIKDAGGRWNPARRHWEIRFQEAIKLGLRRRVLRDEGGVYVTEGFDGNFYAAEESEDGFGWQISDFRWGGAAGWQETEG